MKTKGKTDSYIHILKYTGMFGGVQGLNILMALVRNKLVAMILGPEGMGLISLFNSTIKLVSDSTNLGISMSAVRNISEEFDSGDTFRMHHTIRMIRSWSVLTALLGMLLCLVLSPWLNRYTFTWGNHTFHFMLLSPVVALTAITGGELAILKGLRQLRRLAFLSVLGVVAALVLSIPVYLGMGERGIVPSLLLVALAQMLLTVAYSYKVCPLKLSFRKQVLGEGLGMVRLGIAFVLAGVLGSGAEFLIRSFLNTQGSLGQVGLYSAGYMMTMTYAGMVFSAMETDFFPRLSAVHDDIEKQNQVVNRQIEVSLLILSPLLVGFTIFLPVFLPLLFTGKFMPILGMMQVTVLAMYLRAVKLPIAYLPLAKGDSRSYLFLEAVYDVAVVLLVCSMYSAYGLTGTGVAITASAVLDFLLLVFYTRYKYGYTVSKDVCRHAIMAIGIGLLAYLTTFIANLWIYWGGGAALIALSTALSAYTLKKKTNVWNTLAEKLKRRRHA